jgi:hypothetical protein
LGLWLKYSKEKVSVVFGGLTRDFPGKFIRNNIEKDRQTAGSTFVYFRLTLAGRYNRRRRTWGE